MSEQLRIARRAAMNRSDHFGVSLCNQALTATDAERSRLVAVIRAREELRA